MVDLEASPAASAARRSFTTLMITRPTDADAVVPLTAVLATCFSVVVLFAAAARPCRTVAEKIAPPEDARALSRFTNWVMRFGALVSSEAVSLADATPATAEVLLETARESFIAGLHVASVAGALALLATAATSLLLLRPRAPR